jgi:hypothetical protein
LESYRRETCEGARQTVYGHNGGALGLAFGDSAPIYQTSPRRESFHPMLQLHTSRLPFVCVNESYLRSVPTSPFCSPRSIDHARLDEARHALPNSVGFLDADHVAPFKAAVPTLTTALMPEFLTDIVQSPSLSPASSSTTDNDLEQFDYQNSPATSCASLGGHLYYSPKVAPGGVPIARTSPRSGNWRAVSRELGPIGSGRKHSWDS